MNIQQLRQSLKLEWLSYYEQNRYWLVKIKIWGTYDGIRRPLSGFIVATLSVLEPQFEQLLPFILDLNSNPDQIVAALGLDFNPDEELRLIQSEHSLAVNQMESETPQDKHLASQAVPSVASVTQIAPVSSMSTVHTQKFPSDVPRSQQSIPSLTANTEVAPTRKPVVSVGVATKMAPDFPVKTPHVIKPTSNLLTQKKPVRSLIITTEVPSNRNHVRSLVITTGVDKKAKIPLSSALNNEIYSNSNHVNIQPQDIKNKVNLSPSTNAKSLSSWVDEFCQGTGWDKEENIFI